MNKLSFDRFLASVEILELKHAGDPIRSHYPVDYLSRRWRVLRALIQDLFPRRRGLRAQLQDLREASTKIRAQLPGSTEGQA